MKKRIALILFFALIIKMNSQVETSVNQQQIKSSLPVFNYEIVNFAGNDSNTSRIDVFIQVPFNVVQFVKASNFFKAEYSSTITIYDESKSKVIAEKMWNEVIETKDFNQTSSRTNYNLSLRSFLLVPGQYLFRIEVEDKDSKKGYITESKITVRKFSKNFSVSDIVMLINTDNTKNEIFPNVSRNISAPSKEIPIFFEIYSDSIRNIKINYTIVDKEKKEVYSFTTEKQIFLGNNQVFQKLEGVNLNLGEFLLTVFISKSEPNKSISINKNFFSKIVGLPVSIVDLDKAIKQMTYIASVSEMDYLEADGTEEEKFQRFIQFWMKKKPGSSLEDNEVFNEYYRRVAYSNEHFSSRQEGWRTDMGMVYIILGPPNNVERHPFEYDSKPYEIWEYYELNKQFIFMDATGFGDFRLVSPFYGDIYRYRR
jgi:GWxTD domain-containing protein